MSDTSRFLAFLRHRDWRIWFGLVITFFWLVLGLFIQQRELTRNTEALRLTVEQSKSRPWLLLRRR